MGGIVELERLLGALRPALRDGDWVFCQLPQGRYGDGADLDPLAAVREDEGLTLVLTRRSADAHRLYYEGVFRCIVLQVHSSLAAVGLTAAVASALAEHGIGANVVAGFCHDHLLVPAARAAEALRVLEALSASAAVSAAPAAPAAAADSPPDAG